MQTKLQYTPTFDPQSIVSTKFSSIEVCAGAGGQALGLEQAGFHHVATVEIDKHACASLNANRPEWNIYEEDINSWILTSAKQYQGVDLVAGGVPCPPFSVAGKQLGSEDERDLFPAMISLVRIIKPRIVLIENVRGLLDRKFDAYRNQVNQAFEQIGYTLAWQLVHASEYGVPQLRPRVVAVGLPSSMATSYAFPNPISLTPPTVGEALHDLMSARGWLLADEWAKKADKIAPTIVGGSKKHGGPDLGPTRARKAWLDLGVDGRTIALEAPEADFQGNPRLTVRMVARLQGFPDSWQFIGAKTNAYRQVGNAFPPPVARAIGASMVQALTG
ncbi:DNA cytosine methyltransferase [Corynebacterium canis]|uniref:Cytosine-specific methyltransferase n=1 Tax=Corynebacterium canis TaxID=679663 RepID=A0A5C5UTJ2_9CORY|nr:DNA cytosine methyltransferase [Corynebacterium canis]TWT28800.1 DNA cytosine methyltransferase [Corynebacterium canis]WJY74927.1 Modification methylase AplI [Corynebacterium canis]